MLLVNIFKRKEYIKWILLGMFSALLIFFTVAAAVLLLSNNIYKGIFIEGVNLSGMDMEKAKYAVRERINENIKDEKIVLSYEGEAWSFSLSEVSFKLKLGEALKKAHSIGRNGNIFKRLGTILKTYKEKQYIELEIEFDEAKLKAILENIKKQIDKEGKNASISYQNGEIVINKEMLGEVLDIDANLNLIGKNLISSDFRSIELHVNEKKPEILFEDINKIEEELGSFSTTFSLGQVNRSYNIKLACERINGMIIPVGGVFSMDKALGARTLENGYKEAPVIFKNELVPGTGGGICQVTTTLYVAVLKAKLGVIERTHHSLPLSYVAPGQDATIAEGAIDFKFENTEDYPIFIYAEAKGNKLNIKIFGKKKTEEYKVKLVSMVVEEYYPPEEEVIIDDNLPLGERTVITEAKKGLKVVVYRDTYSKDGELLLREEISEDIYKPVRGKVRVGNSFD